MTRDTRHETRDTRHETRDTRHEIFVCLHGWLGNQFFQYAFIRSLQLKYFPNCKVTFNFSDFPGGSDGSYNYLRDFNIIPCNMVTVPPDSSRTRLQHVVEYFNSRFLERVIRRCPYRSHFWLYFNIEHRIANIFGLYEQIIYPSRYIKPFPSMSKKILCSGYFEAHKYFDDIRDILLEEFTPIHDILPQNLQLMADIRDSESVCVHIRRGDFMKLDNFNVCNEEYFITAMKAIREELPACKFFVFSDDINEVKRTFHFPFDVVYEPEGNQPYETLRLMYNCKHFIISNSTFSWWAHYLSRNDSKIVYAPVPWRWNEDCSGMYMPNMRTIECHKN